MLSQIINSLVPLFALILLGAALALGGFLKEEFLKQLNRLIYFISLPALIIGKLSVATFQGESALRVFLAIFLGCMAALVLSYGLCRLLRLPWSGYGTFAQAVLRGNLALVGLPVLVYDLRQQNVPEAEEIISMALLALGMIMVLYNVTSVILLIGSQQRLGGAKAPGEDAPRSPEHAATPGLGKAHLFRRMTKMVVTNPLIIAAVIGSLLSLFTVPMPEFALSALDLAGQIAVPAALISIGARLGNTRITGRVFYPLAAALMKVAVVPVLTYFAARLLGLSEQEMMVVMIFGACPTAVASYIMACELRGDPELAGGAIALSTLLSGISLAVAMVLF